MGEGKSYFAEVTGYPDWICHDCGVQHGKRIPSLATYHDGDECGWCGENKFTTQPRDYGYPPRPSFSTTQGEG